MPTNCGKRSLLGIGRSRTYSEIFDETGESEINWRRNEVHFIRMFYVNICLVTPVPYYTLLTTTALVFAMMRDKS